MNIFLDTSILFKLYHEEEGTDEIDQFFEEQEIEQVFISEIAEVEFFSAVSKKLRTGELTHQQTDGLMDLFEQDYKNYTIIQIDSTLIKTAKLLIRKYSNKGLRTLDSIQLASLMKGKDNISIAKTSDALLSEIINLEGIKTE
jgi:uncharacterized protein